MKTIKRKVEMPQRIDEHRLVSLKSMGNIREVSLSDRMNCQATIKPISKEEYVLLSTGELKQVVHHASDRTENLRNLEKTMRSLSDLINTNLAMENHGCYRFITFTYSENMTDAEKLYNDFKNFNKRFKRYMEKLGHHYEYIISVEAQARGAFHLHGIFIFDKKAPYIDNAKLSEMWGLGFVSVKAIDKNIDDIGRYLTSYLTDLPVDEVEKITSEIAGGDIKEIAMAGKSKRIIKGARLKLLPVGIRIYRYSRGIKKPGKQKMNYGEAVELLKETGFSKVGEYAVEIVDMERDFKTRYIKLTYKKHINASMKKEGSDMIE